MYKIDSLSYNLGVIDCFNEMLKAGVKKIALSHPFVSKAQRTEVLCYVDNICKKYGTKYYIEDSLICTDLFAKHLTSNIYSIIFYKEENCILDYLALKHERESLIKNNMYTGIKRYELACKFGFLLGYPKTKIDEYIKNNDNKE